MWETSAADVTEHSVRALETVTHCCGEIADRGVPQCVLQRAHLTEWKRGNTGWSFQGWRQEVRFLRSQAEISSSKSLPHWPVPPASNLTSQKPHRQLGTKCWITWPKWGVLHINHYNTQEVFCRIMVINYYYTSFCFYRAFVLFFNNHSVACEIYQEVYFRGWGSVYKVLINTRAWLWSPEATF